MKKSMLLLSSAILAGTFGIHAVTFNVSVPENTKRCYVCGDFNGWDASTALEMTPSGVNAFTLDLPDVTTSDVAKGFKYLCGQDWLYVEKDAAGEEISNRTSIGNPDRVASWRSVPEWGIETAELIVNGLPRQLKIYLPEGYEESTDRYPVIYYNTVQNRYSNAGDDSDNGDYFFGPLSWNAPSTMESLRSRGGKAYIMVQICSMLAENTVEPNPDFVGTGGAQTYLEGFVKDLMPYVEKNWRVAQGPENTTIVGADYGALFSLYAAATHPELFGKSVIMSPMTRINPGVYESIASGVSEGQTYYVSVGSGEPSWMISDTESLYDALSSATGAECFFTLYPGATHNDDAWGQCFPSILAAISSGAEPAAVSAVSSRRAASDNFEEKTYTLYAGADASNLSPIGKLSYTQDFRKKGTDIPVAAFVITNDVSPEFKSKYYWNIACGEDKSSGWLLNAVKDIGFSNSHSVVSWQNIAVFEDGTVADIAAHSKGFRVVTSKDVVMMSQAGDHKSKATVQFPGSDKSFAVNFGSVNSSSDMGALTPQLSVSDNCIEAEITYDFNLNKVDVTETKFGENMDNVRLVSFSAVPAVAPAGSDVMVTLEVSRPCDVEIGCLRDSKTNVGVRVEQTGPSSYQVALNSLDAGLYTLSLNLVSGGNRLDDAAEINVRILDDKDAPVGMLTVNAYEGINWNYTGRYKANFHTHTSQSFDTQFTTTQVVDKYQAADYKILALTDHDANLYPWSTFSLYNPSASDRDAESMGMLAIPGNELSKDRRNSWSETTGGEFNHHNDFFTGRRGQEFISLRESYAYTQAIGGLQIINHPGQYWNLSTEYKNGEKNSPEWHAENFRLYESLIGLEVYNQGNRRPNDRILWDQILTLTMPNRPVWGYSCDDTHTAEQYFRNYQYMLMPALSVDDLKETMKKGATVFSYEYTGSGKALAPSVNEISVDSETRTITIESDDADIIEWIYSTHRTSTSASSTKSTVVGYGKTFDYTGYCGSYVRARLINDKGETAIQPFGFSAGVIDSASQIKIEEENGLSVLGNPAMEEVTLKCCEPMKRISVVNSAGAIVSYIECGDEIEKTISTVGLPAGVYIAVVATDHAAYTGKFVCN